MSDLIYPELPGLAYNLVKRPLMSTLGPDDPSPSGAEVRLRQYQNPLWEFDLIYEWLYDDDTGEWGPLEVLPYPQYQSLLGFFLQNAGSWQSFLFRDPYDYKVTKGALAVTTVGGSKYSQIVRDLGGFAESVLAVKDDPTIYVDDVEKALGIDYSWNPTLIGFTAPGVSWDGQYITWIRDPGPGAVTASFEFYFRTRFKKDDSDFEKFAAQLWLNQKVELRSVRAVST